MFEIKTKQEVSTKEIKLNTKQAVKLLKMHSNVNNSAKKFNEFDQNKINRNWKKKIQKRVKIMTVTKCDNKALNL